MESAQKREKTLIFHINSIHDGGAERVIIQLAYRFELEGYRSILVTSFKDKNEYPVPEAVERISIENEEVKQSRFMRNVSRIKSIRRLCLRYKPVAVISFMVEPSFRALLATIGLPIKNIVSVRNDPKRDYAGVLRGIVGKLIMPHADGCVFQTTEAMAWFPKRLQRKSRVIMNPIDQVFFNQKRTYGESVNVVSLGRLSRQKNHKMLIKAFSKIADKHPDIKLQIYGIGSLNEELEELISIYGMEKRISLKGLTDRPEAILSEAALFVLSSDYEGMPNALMEALAVGTPCISTDCPCGGPQMLIDDGVNGLLVPVQDDTSLASSMDKVLSDKEFAKSLGMNAKNMARSFDAKIVFQEWSNYIESIIT